MARKLIPTFTSEADEQEFWQRHDSTDYIDWSKGKIGVFPELKPSTKTISLRLPESLLAAIKTLANKKDVPYQSLMKVFLSEKLQDELNSLDNKSIQRTTRSRRR
jgi:predicted DNA binding CopG/RHH family protein